jgi:hypothetical protein
LLIDKNRRKFTIKCNKWIVGMCEVYEPDHADYYGLLIQLIIPIRSYKTIDGELNKIYVTSLPIYQIQEKHEIGLTNHYLIKPDNMNV